MRLCDSCDVEKSLDQFRKTQRWHRRVCIDCERGKGRQYWKDTVYSKTTTEDGRQRRKEISQRYWKNNGARRNAEARARHKTLRTQLLELYGGHCTCCGEATFEFLAIDHVNGNGSEDRRRFKKSTDFVRKLLSYGEPRPEYRLLCHNCNSSYGYYKYCPHQGNGA